MLCCFSLLVVFGILNNFFIKIFPHTTFNVLLEDFGVWLFSTELQRPFPKHTNLCCVEILMKIFLPVEQDFLAQKTSSNVDRGHGMIKSYVAALQRVWPWNATGNPQISPSGIYVFFFKTRQINANGGCAWVVYSLVSSTLFPCVCRLNWKNKLSPEPHERKSNRKFMVTPMSLSLTRVFN